MLLYVTCCERSEDFLFFSSFFAKEIYFILFFFLLLSISLRNRFYLILWENWNFIHLFLFAIFRSLCRRKVFWILNYNFAEQVEHPDVEKEVSIKFFINSCSPEKEHRKEEISLLFFFLYLSILCETSI